MAEEKKKGTAEKAGEATGEVVGKGADEAKGFGRGLAPVRYLLPCSNDQIILSLAFEASVSSHS